MENLHHVDKSHCVTTEQKLLWNIMELLKEREAPLVMPQEVMDAPIICELCGKEHKNKGDTLACARLKKKGSANK